MREKAFVCEHCAGCTKVRWSRTCGLEHCLAGRAASSPALMVTSPAPSPQTLYMGVLQLLCLVTHGSSALAGFNIALSFLAAIVIAVQDTVAAASDAGELLTALAGRADVLQYFTLVSGQAGLRCSACNPVIAAYALGQGLRTTSLKGPWGRWHSRNPTERVAFPQMMFFSAAAVLPSMMQSNWFLLLSFLGTMYR